MADVSSFSRGSPSSLQEDTDAFNVRLREVNREMQGLLEKTSEHRRELHRWQAAVDIAPLTAAPMPSKTTIGATGTAASTTATCSPVAFAVTEELRQWVAEQIRAALVQQLPLAVAPLVDQHVGRQLQRFADRLEAVRGSQEELRLTVDTLADQWKERVGALSSAVSRVETNARCALQHAQSDTEAHTQRWLSELHAIRDSSAAAEQRLQLLEQRTSRRLDEAVQGHQTSVRAALAAVDRDAHAWREEVSSTLRQQTMELQMRSDATEAHVVRLEGVVASVSAAVGEHANDLRGLMDGAVVQGSEVRACRRDVNRLEMYVQCVAESLAAGTGDSNRHPDGKGDSTMASAHLAALQRSTDGPSVAILMAQELSRVKEQLGFLSGRLEGLERHVQQLDTAVLVAGGGRSHHAGGTAASGGGDEDMLMRAGGSARSPTASTRRPSVGPVGSEYSSVFNNDSTLTSVTPSQRHSQQCQQQQQQRQIMLRQPFPQAHYQQQQQRPVYPSGMNQSEERPMSVVVGGSGANSLSAAPSPTYSQRQRLHGGNFFPAGTPTRPPSSTEAAAAVAAVAPMQTEALREVPRGYSPPQRRTPPVVVPVKEEEGEDEHADSSRNRGDAASSQVHGEKCRHSLPTGADEMPSVSRYSAKSSSLYNTLGRSLGAGASPASPGDASGHFRDSADEDSYVSRSESHAGASGPGGARSASSSHLEASRCQSPGQYPPAPASDSESERENRNLSRLPID